MRKIIKCKKCNQEKEHSALGLCKKCYWKQWHLNNKDKVSVRMKKWYLKNKEGHLRRVREWQLKNKDRISTRMKEWQLKNKDRILAQRKERYHNASGKIHIKNDGNHKYWAYDGGKYVHTVIAEKILGRRLKSNECVHHVDGNGLNNSHNNLVICTRSYHSFLHRRMEEIQTIERTKRGA